MRAGSSSRGLPRRRSTARRRPPHDDRPARPGPRRDLGGRATSASGRVGEAILALRRFMFERVYLGAPSHARAPGAPRGGADRGHAPTRRRARPRRAMRREMAEFVAGMTDRFASASRRPAWRGSRSRRSMSPEPRDIVTVVRARTPLRKAAPYAAVPVPRGANPSFWRQPGEEALPLLRLRRQRRRSGRDRVRGRRLRGRGRETRGAVQRARSSTRRRNPPGETTGVARKRLFELLEPAATFLERHLWDTAAGGPGARDSSPGGGSMRRSAVSSGSASRRRRGPRRERRSRRVSRARSSPRRALEPLGSDYFAGRLTFPLADARARILGFRARRLREDDPLPAKYVNSPEGELFQKGDLLYGLDRAKAAIRSRVGRSSSRATPTRRPAQAATRRSSPPWAPR